MFVDSHRHRLPSTWSKTTKRDPATTKKFLCVRLLNKATVGLSRFGSETRLVMQPQRSTPRWLRRNPASSSGCRQKLRRTCRTALCVMGGAGEYQARQNGQCVLKPSRDQPESDQLCRIVWKMRQRQEAPLDPREEFGCRGQPRWREWRIHGRGEDLAWLCRFSIAFASGCRRNGKPRLRCTASRSGLDAKVAAHFVNRGCPCSWLGFRCRLGIGGYRSLGNEWFKTFAAIEVRS